jgi:hypothetical protein
LGTGGTSSGTTASEALFSGSLGGIRVSRGGNSGLRSSLNLHLRGGSLRRCLDLEEGSLRGFLNLDLEDVSRELIQAPSSEALIVGIWGMRLAIQEGGEFVHHPGTDKEVVEEVMIHSQVVGTDEVQVPCRTALREVSLGSCG